MGPHAKGNFSVSGKLPEITSPAVRSFKGWFEEVLPTYPWVYCVGLSPETFGRSNPAVLKLLWYEF